MGSDLSAIRERTQETDTRIRTLRDEIEALRTTVSSLPSLHQPGATLRPTPPIPPRGGPGADRRRPSAAPPARRRPPRRPPASRPARMLDSAKSDYYAGQWTLALSGFDALDPHVPALRGRGRSAVLHRRDATTPRTSGARRSTPTAWCSRTTATRARCPTRTASAGAPTRRTASSTRRAKRGRR